jgi:hypothetical protein
MTERVERRMQSFSGGNCPFRGMVTIDGVQSHVKLDERCPDTVPAVIVYGSGTKFRTDPETEETTWYGDPGGFVPILDTDSYCHTCVYSLVREKEMGLESEGSKNRAPSKGTRTRRRRRA